MTTRIVGHLDMDAFFASVEERDRPRLKGKPIVVGGDPQDGRGRGIVATANYAARKYGIHSAMPISQAWRASEDAKKRGEPEVVFIQGSHEKYGVVSDRIYGILKDQLHDIACRVIKETSDAAQYKVVRLPYIERASIDEAYFDLSPLDSYEKAALLAQKIKEEIKHKEKLTCSIGIGPNKLIAKIASDMQKPDGLTIIHPKEVEKFLEPLSIRKIPGIGPKSEILFNKKGVKVVKDLKIFSQKEMADMLGVWGLSLYKKVRGIDDSPLAEEREAKSIGEQETFMTDTLDTNILFSALSKISVSVVRSLHGDGFESFKTIVFTVRFDDFKTMTRSKTLTTPAKTAKELESIALQLLLPFLDTRENPHRKLIRLVGIRAEKLQFTLPSFAKQNLGG